MQWRNEKKTLFISDLHLDETDPASVNQFKNLIHSMDDKVDALYILGDFFETWIGDDHHTPFNQSVIHLLQTLEQKHIPLYIMHGNRDFLLGKKFLIQTNAMYLPDETCISLYGTPVLLMHGDALCIDDHAYQRARKWLRNRCVQCLFLWLPLCLRKRIANKMRRASKKHTANAAEYIMDVNQQEVTRVMQQHQVRYLIHGHTHRPAIHPLTLNNESRIVLGAWHHTASVLVWYHDGSMALMG